MKLLRIEARSFGKLKDFVLEPQAGLNIYRQPNEYGKTTLIYFIYYMFYGYEAKLIKKYLPWSGAEIAGSLEFQKDGRTWRIERRHPIKGAEKRKVLCITTGEELALAAREQPGPHFLGLDGETFLRTFCITQGDLLFARTDGLDVALKNMAATGDENVSFKQAEDWLNKQHTHYMYRGKNQGPLLDKKQELAAGINELEQVRRQLDEQITEHREWEELEKAIPQSDSKINELQERLKKAEGSDALRLLGQLETLAQKKPMEPPAVPQEQLNEWEQAYRAREQAMAEAAEAEEEKTRLTDQLQLIAQNVSQFGFHALSGQELQRLQNKKGFPWWAVCLGAALAADAAALLLKQWPWYVLSGLLLAAALVLLFGKGLARRRICHAYGAANEQQLLQKWQKYQQVLAQQEELNTARNAAAQTATACKTAAEAANARFEALRAQTRLFTPEELQQARIQWGVYESSQKQGQTALQEQALLNGRTREELEQMAQGAELLEETAAQVRQLLGMAEEENRRLRNRRDELDPRLLEALWARQAALKEKNEEAKATVQAWEEQLAAVQTALSWLNEANEEMNTRFAPQLCALAGEYLGRLTDGKYGQLLLDTAFCISLKTAEGTYPLEQFSSGTKDAVYFAFRLAVSTLLAQTALPMVLDDPFVNLDENRRTAAEGLLQKATADRQILYFTCR